MTSSIAHGTPTPDHRCVFCAHDALDIVLEETDHFLVIADHAPLAEGHLLIVPRDHYACYGALPFEFDEEALELRERVTDFLMATYRAPIFFEHGVFRQTVFHAHLHALPLGAANLAFADEVRSIGSPADSPDALRAWYADQGHYFYLDTERDDSGARTPLLFPAELGVYFQVMGALRTHTAHTAAWIPPAIRQAQGGAKMRAVAAAWRDYFGVSGAANGVTGG
ncbi:MAG TPA: HIT family protein [Ktedonobacterales bacterium]|jgi:diadenosine tetraphosphate (Ap4A) HIT family hydrolase